ncbi:N-6 DNA methylase [Bradyrhizobium sp. BR 10289]|uniref:HsdM family class I SAM-dependent methyltransferase n=1 Tax=Bradyrhizobium sp. BR 10289 TaxID=2749993 RepID=UPI001C648744|nr:N-6 DNA methylase [Bradyrhizobium sp. BR 10289]MBW7971874.1 N-6 DNA methylase [Bradyrhizobium sp. BR 10289]
MLQILNPHDLTTRRNIGAYYTSGSIASVLANWAIRTSGSRVLEPSFGGGSLVVAALLRLSELGATTNPDQVVGYDIDRKASALLRSALSTSLQSELITSDFLAVSPPSPERKFHCIIANPPFIRHHRNKDDLFKARCEQLGLPKNSDLSCLFVMHALTFLRKGGRMAFVLPASFLFADYARPVRDALRRNFEKVKVIRLAFRAFAEDGAEEKGILVLADCFGSSCPGSWAQTVALTEETLPKLVDDAHLTNSSPTEDFARILHTADVVRFDELAQLQIGVVTGANKYFVIDESMRAKHRLSKDTLIPIAARSAQITGLKFGMAEHTIQAATNKRVWLLSPSKLGRKNSSVRKYLESIPQKIREETLWFKKRPDWFRPEPIFADAILTYMNHRAPRLALLSPQITATNTFHLVTFKNRKDLVGKQRVALALLTSLAQASAEMEGRAYGGGLLKLEPAGARRILLPKFSPAPEIIRSAFSEADANLRAGDEAAARDIADRTLLFPSIRTDPESVTTALRRSIEYSRRIRTSVSNHTSV